MGFISINGNTDGFGRDPNTFITDSSNADGISSGIQTGLPTSLIDLGEVGGAVNLGGLGAWEVIAPGFNAAEDFLFYASTALQGRPETLAINFDQPVDNLSFTVFDLDASLTFTDQVRIEGIDANGNLVPVTWVRNKTGEVFNGTTLDGIRFSGTDTRNQFIGDIETERLNGNNDNNYQVTLGAPVVGLRVTLEAPFTFSSSDYVAVGGFSGTGMGSGTGTVIGNVFTDTNGDNTEFADAGFEPGIEGVTVVAKDLAGNIVASTTTNAAGFYELTGVPAGDIIIEVPTAIDGEGLVQPFVGDPSVDSSANPATGQAFINVPAGGTVAETDFGYTDTQEPGTLTIAAAPGTPIDPATGNPLTAENGDPAQIVITRNGPTDQPLVVTLTDGDPSETDAPTTVTIPAGASSVTVDIPSVDDPIVDGPQVSTITATAPGFSDATQDVTVADDDVPEPGTLTIAAAPGTPTDPATGLPATVENGNPVDVVITRTGPLDQPLVVTLLNIDPTETDLPSTVTIPAGQSSITVPVFPVDDPDIDGPQFAPITAVTSEFPDPTLVIVVADDDVLDPPELTIEPAPGSPVDPATGNPLTAENGAPAQIVISRNGPTDEPLVVTLSDGDPSETDAPTTVTIPAGQSSVTVDIPSVDDTDVDGPQVSTITATAPGFPDATQDVTVADDDLPTLTVAPAPGTPTDPATGNPLTAENGDPAQIVITRDGPTDQPLEVFLTDGDPTETDAPVSVIIPAGQSSVTVDIPSVDDPDVDGPQVSTITASAPGTNPGSIDVTVADDDLPALSIEPLPGSPVDPATGNPLTAENGDPALIVISRTGPTDQPLVVTLSDGDPSETDAPETVTIPAGQSSVLVPVPSVDDTDIDGPQVSTITATAPGTAPAEIDVTVADDDVPGATDDVYTVFESESAGDSEGNVLDNDSPDSVEVVTVNGQAGNVGEFIDLAEGGRVKIDADGSIDFDADGDFDNLNEGEFETVTVEYEIGTPGTVGGGDPIVEEIEGLSLSGFSAFSGNGNASGGQAVITFTAGATATLNSFGGDAGTYDITLTAQDLPDAVSEFDILVNGAVVGTVVTDQSTDSGGFFNGTFTDFTVADVALNPGDEVQVRLESRTGAEFGTIDKLTLTPKGGDGTPTVLDQATVTINVWGEEDPALTIEPAPGTPTDPATGNPLTAENGDPAQIVITRNGPIDQPLVVTLTDGDPSETDAPTTVTIPAGASSVTVDIPSVDDTDVDGPQVSTITASAPGFPDASQDVTVADDDELELTIEPGPNQPVDPATGLPVTQENGDPVELVISRNGPTDQPLVVTLTDGDPSETDSPVTVTIPAGEDSVTVLVDPVEDDIVDGDTVAPVTATAPDYAPATQPVIVEDDDEPALTIEPAPNTPIDPATGNPLTAENGAPAQIVISRNTPTDQPLEVFLTDGDPSETDAPVSVIIPAGATSVTVDIPSVDDPIVDGDQVSTITATAPGLAPATQDVTVADDDELELTIEPGPNQPVDPATGLPVTQENGDPVELVISRNGPTDQPLVVTLTDGDPSETDSPTTVTIPAGEDSVTVLIDPVDDPEVDGDQTAPITATAPDYAPATQPVIVEDDDEPALTIEPAANTPIDPATGNPLTAENGAPAQIVISRNTPTDQPLEVFLTDGDPSETDAPVSVIIPAGATSVTVDIPSVDDPIVDGDQVSTITATAPGLAPATQDVTVADDDELELTIEPGPNQPVDPATGLPVTQENGDPVELVISRNGPTDQPLVVTLTDGDPSETDSPTTVTIPAGEDSVTVLIDPVDDPEVDGDQTAPITATAPDYAPATQPVIVEDDDEPALTIEPGPNAVLDGNGNPVTQENGDPVEFVISRTGPNDQPLVVTISNGDPSETDAPTTVTIPAGEDSITVTVDPVDDQEVDRDQVSTIGVTAPGFEPDSVDVVVEDDDMLMLTIEPAPNQPVDANGDPITQEDGDQVSLVLTRNGPIDQPLTVTLFNNDDSEVTAPFTVVIPAGQASVEFTVDPVDDGIADGTQSADILAFAKGYTTDTVKVVVEDAPQAGSISGRAFSDENGDGLSNDDFGGPSQGVANILVRLLDENGVQVGFDLTDINGDYSFADVAAGNYTIEFREGQLDPTTRLTEQDAFGNAFDDIDSDAFEVADGIYRVENVTVAGGTDTSGISIGFAPDLPPLPTEDDTAMTCADELLVVDVVANDGEAGSGPITITEVNGHAISEGQSVTTSAGTVVTLTGGQLVIDGEAAYADLDINESANEVITYTATDGVLTGTADVNVTFKGDANSVASLDAAFKADGGTLAMFFVEPVSIGDFDEGYTLNLMGTQPEDVVGSGTYMAAYCIDGDLPIEQGLFTVGTITVLTEENAAAASSNINTDNVDAVSWLLNEQFEFKDNGDGTGDTYTDFEVQEAIWTLMNGQTYFINAFGNPELTDNDNGVRDGAEIGTVENINEIVSAALSHGEGFVAQDGDIVGLIIDPFDPTNQEQPFVIAVNYDDIDCIC